MLKLYSQALDSVDATIPIEIQRILLANRAQAFVFYGVIYEALRDLNHALSPQFTNQDSPKTLTAKCRYRRAKLLCTMARYDEAQADYHEFAKIMGEIGTAISGEELKLKEDLNRKAAASDDSEQRRRDELMRAIDVSAMSISMQLVSQDKIMSHRLEALSFGQITARDFPYPHRRYKNVLGQILTQNQ